jgi:Ras-related protein Rab-18
MEPAPDFDHTFKVRRESAWRARAPRAAAPPSTCRRCRRRRRRRRRRRLRAPPSSLPAQILLVGDSGVGKSSLLLRFATGDFEELSPTIGVDFKSKVVDAGGKRVKLTIWDTAGQERFRTLTSSYYRGAQGVVLVYDVTRRETFDALAEVWLKEVEAYATVEDAVRCVVANKSDLAAARAVSKAEGAEFARRGGCLFVETSAKDDVAVGQAFEELVLRILETPALLGAGPAGLGLRRAAPPARGACCG